MKVYDTRQSRKHLEKTETSFTIYLLFWLVYCFKVACRVQIWKKTFYQNSDRFGYCFIKNNIMFMYYYFVFTKKNIILSLCKIDTWNFTMYILTILTCPLFEGFANSCYKIVSPFLLQELINEVCKHWSGTHLLVEDVTRVATVLETRTELYISKRSHTF